MKRLMVFALAMGALLISRLNAQCSGSDIDGYWDNSFDFSSYPTVADYWGITEGDGCSDGCGGTIQYFVDASFTDSFGTFSFDGGGNSDTVSETAPGFARNDVSGSPSDNDQVTFNSHGYAYICDCDQCLKLATFAFSSVFQLTTTYYSGPIPIGNNNYCKYAATACTSGIPTCNTSNYLGFYFSDTCPSMIKVGYGVVGGVCTGGYAYPTTDTVRVCT